MILTPDNSAPTRREHDLLGERDTPQSALGGIQTLRAMENFDMKRRPRLRRMPSNQVEAFTTFRERGLVTREEPANALDPEAMTATR